MGDSRLFQISSLRRRLRLRIVASLIGSTALFIAQIAEAGQGRHGVPYICVNTGNQGPSSWNVPVIGGTNYPYTTITYVNHADGQSESLDLYLPPGVVNPPLIIGVHGGGWTGSSKKGLLVYLQQFVTQGYAVANLNFRLAGSLDTTNGGLNPTGMVTSSLSANLFPTGLQDVRCAVRYLRANASTLGVRGDVIAAYGVSSGGNLVAMLGTTLDNDPTVYGNSNGGPQTLDSSDCAVGVPGNPNANQSVTAPASIQMAIDESGNDTIGQLNNTQDNSAWGIVQYFGEVADVEHLFDANFRLARTAYQRCTAPGFPPAQRLQCLNLGALAGNAIFQSGSFAAAFPDTQFRANAANPTYVAPSFFILSGALDPVVGPQQSADLFNTLSTLDAAAGPVLVESIMSNQPSPSGVAWSAPAMSGNGPIVNYFLMPDEGHIPALLAPGLNQTSDNNNGTNLDLQNASCAVLNALNMTFQSQ